MNDDAPATPVSPAGPPHPDPSRTELPHAEVRRRSHISPIWLIPAIAVMLAAYLGWQTLSARGPLITIIFQTGQGLVAGQTKVEHKAVALGTVEGIRLSDDMRTVIVQARMTSDAAPRLTDHARFWVVRPRLTAGSVSGLETLVSGSYIEMDPGAPGGQPERHFTGLSAPPGVRSDEPGHTFTLTASRLGSLGPGSPVFYRDVVVGEVLGFDQPQIEGPIAVRIFIRAPYDSYVRQGTHFWNASGLSVQIGPQGVHVEVASIQAVLSGGIAFSTPEQDANKPMAANDVTFELYRDYAAAQNAGYHDNIKFVSYFQNSVSGLSAGSAVRLYGIQVGSVTDVALQMDPATGKARVRVAYDVQPERVFSTDELPKLSPLQITRNLVQQGMRAQIDTESYVTGQEVLGLDFAPNATPAQVGREGDALVVPSQAGGLQDIAQSLSGIVSKLNSLPLNQIGANLNHLVGSLDSSVNGTELKDALHGLSATLNSLNDLVRKADAGATPALKRLPEIASELQGTLERANRLVGSFQAGYGGNSDISRNLERLLDQTNDAMRSIRLLADFLNRHPSALIRGRPGEATQ